MRRNSIFFATCVAVGVAGSAQAGMLDGWDMTISFNGGNWSAAANPQTWEISEVTNPDTGKTFFRITGAHSNANWSCDWSIDVDPDPFIFSNINVTNNAAGFSTFSITVDLPVFPAFPGPNTMDGSISGSLLNTNNDAGAEVRTFGGNPFYEAFVDGGSVRTLYDDPSSATVVGFGTTAIPTQSFLGEAAPPALSEIAIRNRFELSGNDSVNFVSTFQLVPTPAGFSVLVFAGIAASRRRRA